MTAESLWKNYTSRNAFDLHPFLNLTITFNSLKDLNHQTHKQFEIKYKITLIKKMTFLSVNREAGESLWTANSRITPPANNK